MSGVGGFDTFGLLVQYPHTQPLCERFRARLPLEPARPSRPAGGSDDTGAQPAGGPVVRLQGIKKSFGRVEVLHGVDLSVRAGEHVVIFGPSGSGKSTVLRTINLLEQPSEGSVRVLGVEYGPGPVAAARSAAARSSCAARSAWSSSSSTSSRT